MGLKASLNHVRKSASRLIRETRKWFPVSGDSAPVDDGVGVHWFRLVKNFGDLITPLLFQAYGHTPNYRDIGQANVLSTGSILQDAPIEFSGHIIGSGLIRDEIRKFDNATIWAVRGELTRQRIGAAEDTVLGDPGLLLHQLLEQRQERCFALGIIPHFVDVADPRLEMYKSLHKQDITIIDVRQAPMEVVKEVDQCDCILSSSLHGLIVADTLGIPSVWAQFSDGVIGNGFKFHDYYSAFGVDRKPITPNGREGISHFLNIAESPPVAVSEVRERLDDVFKRFKV